MPNNTITNTTTTTTTNTNNNSWSRSGDGTLTQQRPQPQPRKCFQCGRIGHETADCSSTITTQTKDGQEAFQEYLEQIEERRQSFAGTQKKRKERHKMYHCRKLQSWMQLQLQLQQIDKDEMDVTSNTKHCGSMQSYWYHGPYDPVLQVANIRRPKDTKNGTPACSGSGSSMSGGDATTSMEQIMNTTQRQPTTTTRTQEMHASYFEMAKHMHHSYREFFHSIMEPTRHQFNQDTTTTTPKKNRSSTISFGKRH